MRIFPRLLLVLLAGCAPGSTPSAPAPPVDGAAGIGPLEALAAARDARASGDLRAWAAALARVDSLAPGHPNLTYTRARTHGLAGEPAAALAVLRRIAPWGDARDLAADSAFAALRGDTAFRRIAADAAANARPLVRGDAAFVVPGAELFPESIAHDAATGAWYLGSLVAPRVVRVTPAGVTDFARAEGPGRTIGLKVDAPRRRLWVAVVHWDSAAPPAAFTGVRARTALHAYDVDTGVLLRRVVPTAPGPHLFNDVDVAADGTVYVTDLNGNAVWRARWSSPELERVDRPSRGFHWPNGIALDGQERRLYVAHLEGISVVDLASGRRTPLPHPAAVPTADTDGLYACGGSLVAIQRLGGFEQVLRLRLSPDGRSVTGAEVLERRHPAYRDPTTGVIVGGSLFYIADSGFSRLSADGQRVTRAAEGTGTTVLRLPLGGEPGCTPEARP